VFLLPPDLATATSYEDAATLPFAELHRPWGTTYMKLLSVSRVSNTVVNIIRFKSGMQLPRHHHSGPVHAYTLEGAWKYKEYDWVARTGSYVNEAPGANHTLQIVEDSEILFVNQGAFIYFDESGKIMSFSDALTITEDCRRALSAQRIPFPEQVIRD